MRGGGGEPRCGCSTWRSSPLVHIKSVFVVVLLSCSLFVSDVSGLWCDRTPAGVLVPKMPGDDGYKIDIRGDPTKPDKYIPENVYTGKLFHSGVENIK